MARFSIHIKRGLGRLLLVVFLHYLIGITCFIHSHAVGNRFITHSHYPFSSQGIPLKTHSSQDISLLSALSGFLSEAAGKTTPDIDADWFEAGTLYISPDFYKKSARENTCFLRGPPSFI